MKTYGFAWIAAAALALAACGSKNEQPAGSASGAENQVNGLGDLAGQYEGTFTCPTCQDVRSILVVQPDSTFQMRTVYKVNGNDSISTQAGTAQLASAGSLTLVESGDSSASHTLTFTDASVMTYASGDKSGSFTRKTKVIADEPGRRLSYWVSEPDSTRSIQVYQNTRNFVNIHKRYLDGASADQKALVAYYAEVYNTGCKAGRCELTDALGIAERGGKEHREIVRTRVSADSALASLGELAMGDLTLTSLSISRQPGTDMTRISAIVEKSTGEKFNCQDLWTSAGGVLGLKSHNSNPIGTAPGSLQPPSARPGVPFNTPRTPAGTNAEQPSREELLKQREKMLKDRKNGISPPAAPEKSGTERQVQQRSAGGN